MPDHALSGAAPHPVARPRPAGAADADAVAGVVVSSGLFDAVEVQAVAALFDAHVRDGAQQRWLVVEAAGEVAGTALYRPVEGADAVWDLTMIAVAAPWQGCGVGSGLLAHVEAELLAQGERMLLVQTSGLPRFRRTRQFYVDRGYVRHGEVPDYWADGDDMVLFGKRFSRRATGG